MLSTACEYIPVRELDMTIDVAAASEGQFAFDAQVHVSIATQFDVIYMDIAAQHASANGRFDPAQSLHGFAGQPHFIAGDRALTRRGKNFHGRVLRGIG